MKLQYILLILSLISFIYIKFIDKFYDHDEYLMTFGRLSKGSIWGILLKLFYVTFIVYLLGAVLPLGAIVILAAKYISLAIILLIAFVYFKAYGHEKFLYLFVFSFALALSTLFEFSREIIMFIISKFNKGKLHNENINTNA